MEKKYTYSAFISYSSKNKRIAKALWRKLEHYRYPVVLQKQHENVPKKLHVFLDRGDISPGGTVEKALSRELVDSKKLIVICSPASAISSYVEFEVKSFFEIGHTADDVIPYIIAGEVNKNSPRNCYVPSLFGKEDKDTVNGVSVIRDGKFKAFVGILASLGDLKFDTIYKREKIRKRNNIIIKAILFLFIFFIIGFSIFQWKNAKRNQAYNYFVKANELYENGNSSYALAYYKKSLQMDNNPVVRDKVYSIITNDSWLVEKNEVTPINEEIYVHDENDEFSIIPGSIHVNQFGYDEYEEISKQLGVENGWGPDKNISGMERLVGLSSDRKYVVLKDETIIRVLNRENNLEIFRDTLEKDSIYMNCLIDENRFAYYQERNEGFIFKRIDFNTNQLFEIAEDKRSGGFCFSCDEKYFVYITLIENNLSEITVCDVNNNTVKWKRKDRHRCLLFFPSPDNVHFIYRTDSDSNGNSELVLNEFSNEYNFMRIPINSYSDFTVHFSNNGSKVGIATDNKLSVYNVKDGSEAVNSLLLEKRIGDFKFISDNDIQLTFYPAFNNEQKEFSLLNNDENWRLIRSFRSLHSDLDEWFDVENTIRVKNDYICNLSNGFIQIRDMYASKNHYIELDDYVYSAEFGFYGSPFLCINDSQNALFVGFNYPKGIFFDFFSSDSLLNKQLGRVLDVYSLNFENNKYLVPKKRIILDEYIIDIPIITNERAIVFCYDEDNSATDIYFVDLELGGWSSFSLGKSLGYKVVDGKILYNIYQNSDGVIILQKFRIENWRLIYEWSKDLKDALNFKYALTIDNHGNIYIYSNYSSEVSVFNSKGEQINSIEAVNNVQLLSVDNNCKLMGMAFESFNQGKEGIEVVNLKDNSINFRADYGKKDKVKFSKIAFSEDSTKLYVSGSYLSKKNEDFGFKLGFFDIWDINTGSKLSSVSNENIGEIFDFEIENEKAYIYTRKGTVIKYLFDTSKETLKELKSDALYQVLGGWTLNKNGVPELITKEVDEHGNLYSWLTTPKEKRTIHSMSSVLLSDVENDY